MVGKLVKNRCCHCLRRWHGYSLDLPGRFHCLCRPNQRVSQQVQLASLVEQYSQEGTSSYCRCTPSSTPEYLTCARPAYTELSCIPRRCSDRNAEATLCTEFLFRVLVCSSLPRRLYFWRCCGSSFVSHGHHGNS